MRTKTVLPDSFCVLSSGLNPSFGTLRVFCGRKKLPFAGYSVVKDSAFALSGFGATGYVNLSIETCDSAGLAACLAVTRFRLAFFRSDSSERRLVENTGLEPVTSWLQTRRSPS